MVEQGSLEKTVLWGLRVIGFFVARDYEIKGVKQPGTPPFHAFPRS